MHILHDRLVKGGHPFCGLLLSAGHGAGRVHVARAPVPVAPGLLVGMNFKTGHRKAPGTRRVANERHVGVEGKIMMQPGDGLGRDVLGRYEH